MPWIRRGEELTEQHECSAGDKLDRLLVGLAGVEQAQISYQKFLDRLDVRLEENSKQITQILTTQHQCYQAAEMRRLAGAVDYLKEEIHKYQGKSKWDDRIWSVFSSVLCAIVIGLAFFFIKGGSIS